MEDNKMEYDKPVDYRVHESILARLESTNKRLYILIIIVFMALVVTNAGWIVYENQFEDVTVTENTQDGNGINLIGGGNVTYGTDAENNENPTP